MSEVATTHDKPMVPHSQDQGAALIQVIERAAMNPDVDIEKMERLFAMHERIVGKQAEEAFNRAMSAAQSEMGLVSADAENSLTHTRYATYGKLDKALRPIYTGHGFALSFGTEDAPLAEMVRVVCCVSHEAGHSRHYRVDMPADGKGARGGDAMTKTHATGAAMSYGMRYLLKMIFNVAIGEEDRDGNTATVQADIEPGLMERMLKAASGGIESYKAEWQKLTPEERVVVKPVHNSMKERARQADEDQSNAGE